MDDKHTLIDHKELCPETKASRRRALQISAVLITLMAIALVVAIAYNIHQRETAAGRLRQTTNAAAIQEVRTVHPDQSSPTDEIVLPGATQPYINSPVYARASGYLVKW